LFDLLDEEPEGEESEAEEGEPPLGASSPDATALRRGVSVAPRFTMRDVASSPRKPPSPPLSTTTATLRSAHASSY